MHLLKTAVRAAAVVVGVGCSTAAYAVTTTYTVNTLAAGLADANAGDGICQTATAGECSLRAALEEINAAPASIGDDFAVVFDGALAGDIQPTAAAQRMITTTLGNTRFNDYLGLGAFYHVNALRPVVIDFDNRIGVTQQNDLEYAAFFVQSDDVVIQNFQNDAKRDVVGGGFANVAGIVGAASAFVVGGSRVTIRNGLSSDQATDAMESCVSLIDGASDILVEDYYCRGSAGFGLFIDEDASVSNITLNRFETEDGLRFADIWITGGLAADDRTIVDGLTITDSEFRSSANQSTVTVRANSTLNGLSISGSRFLGANLPGITVDPNAELGTTRIENNVSTGTGYFFGTDVNVTHTGTLTIRGNTLTGNLSDAVFLQSPTSGTVIENNQFLNQRSASLVAGVRIATGASGTNNVIRNNVFDQASPVTDPPAPVNRFAIWMRANPNGPAGSGNSGWSILNNTVRNIFGTDFGPIYNDGDNNTLISGNTFGDGTRGAVVPDPAPENDDSFFVVNVDTFSNGKIQTWRPTGAVFSGVSIRASFAPVDPPRPGNTAPTTPVFIDVYYTATDKAETYLGRIPGMHSAETTFEFTSTATTGAIRAQVTDAEGRSSQYSGAVALQEGLNAGADDDGDGLPNGAECTISVLGVPLLCPDSDGDGIRDFQDPDDDNDGIPTRTECPTGSPCVNTDGDMQPNHLDLDSDNDGILDAQECPAQVCRDTDGDGVANYIDIDSDGDGLSDNAECPDSGACADVDGNGVQDYLELPLPIVVRGTGGGSFGHLTLLALGGLALLRRRGALPLAGLLGIAAPFAAQADGHDSLWSRFYVGAKVGAVFTNFDDGDVTEALQEAGYNLQAESDKSDKLGYGGWLGYALTRNLGLELSYTTGADERVRYTGSTVGDLEAVLDVASPHLTGFGDTYLTRLRYHHELSERWFLSPRVGVGVTRTRESVTSGDRRARQTDTSFAWAAGAGVHYALSPDWSVGVGADVYGGANDNAYAIVSAQLEWRVPSAFRPRSHVQAIDPPVQVIPAPVPAPVAPPATPPPAPVAEAPAEPVASAPVIALNGVVFESDSDRLGAQSRPILDQAAVAVMAALRSRPEQRFEVGGHTDSSGRDARNVALSQGRANTVKRYLVDKGVPADRLVAVGHGSAQAIASNDTVEGRAANRRVELRALD